jgi:hypothetical protein
MGALSSQVSIDLPVLDEVSYKSKKLTVHGSKMKPGMFIVVGNTAYLGTAKSDDGTKYLAKVPKTQIPPGTPVRIKLRNPDGGESNTITFTR